MTTPTIPPGSPAIEAALAALSGGRGLTQAEAEDAFSEIMRGVATPEAMSGLLLGLRARGESPEEVAGAVQALRQAMRAVPHPNPELLVDTCGTGGGTITTLNLSTAAAFVAAGAGVAVAKHGNRSFTSRSGSADVLEALGVGIEITPERAGEILREIGLVFMFAPTYHPAMRHVAPIRRALGVPTIMNLVGPLANPASVGRQVVGVAEPARGPLLAAALARLGTRHALVVHAEIGMDELSPVGSSLLWEVRGDIVTTSRFDPTTVGLDAPSLDGLAGGEPAENALVIRSLLETGKGAAAVEGAVLLNAAAAIFVGDGAPTFPEAVERAREALQSGRAAEKLAALREATG